MLLIYPPMAKGCEPPAGPARLAGFLRGHGVTCTLLDANLEGQLFLLANPGPAEDTWSRRAKRNLDVNLTSLRKPELYSLADRYNRAVTDLNRVLEITGRTRQIALSIANYQDDSLSPLKSRDLLRAAERPGENIFYDYFSSRLPELIEEKNPPLIGFSVNYLSQALITFAMLGFVRERYPDLPIVLGGGLITSWLRSPNWVNPFGGLIDHLVAGPGEEPLLALLVPETTQQCFPPDYTGLPLADYLSPGLILPYAASSGCYWNQCAFCPEKAEGNPYLPISPARVVDELHWLVAQTRPRLIHLLDNAVSPALMREMITRPPGVEWYGFARVSPQLADPDFCRGLAQSGCVMLKLGLESGDQSVLDAMHKGIDLDLVSKTLHCLHRAGIATYVYLLFGTPSESEIEARRTLTFMANHAEAITFVNLAIFNLPLGGPEAGTLELTDLYEGDLSLYHDFIHPRGWGRREIRRFLDREFTRHPAMAAIIRRDPPHFTSNHAAFFRI